MTGTLYISNLSEIEDADYYVDYTNGSDSYNGQTPDTAWKTLTKVNAQDFSAGTVIRFKCGETWNEEFNYAFKTGGTSGNPIVFTKYGTGAQPIFNGHGLDIVAWEGLAFIRQTNYVTFDNIQLIDAKYAGFRGEQCTGLRVTNCYTYDTGRAGIIFVTCVNSDIYHNEIELANVVNAGEGKDGFDENISVVNTSYNVDVSYNTVHDCYDPASAGSEGINIKVGCYDVYVHHNEVYNNPKHCFGVDAWTATSYNIYFYSNIARDSVGTKTAAIGYVLSAEQAEGTAHDIWFYNNVAYNLYHSGLCIPSYNTGLVEDSYFINNTVYNCGNGFCQDDLNVDNIIIRNNIFSNNDNDPQITIIEGEDAHFTIDHNLFFTPNTAKGTDSVQDDPHFVTPGSDFHLQAGSHAIGAGSLTDAPLTDYDGVSRGAAVDIGAFEYV